MKLKINQSISSNHFEVVEMMGDYFASIADDIGKIGDNVSIIDQHDSLQAIAYHKNTNCDHLTFHFNEISLKCC